MSPARWPAVTENPFYVLELPVSATPLEIERQGQKLLSMITVGLQKAMSYPTPLGGMPRDADLVRRCLDELRDPRRRVLHEVWASLEPSVEATLEAPDTPTRPRWANARRQLGWGNR